MLNRLFLFISILIYFTGNLVILIVILLIHNFQFDGHRTIKSIHLSLFFFQYPINSLVTIFRPLDSGSNLAQKARLIAIKSDRLKVFFIHFDISG